MAKRGKRVVLRYREVMPGRKPLGASGADPTVIRFLTDGMEI
jgi:hypothetical protein